MALDGGGGGGGPIGVGNSFTGPATGLDIYGDFCAAYSGQVLVANSTVTCLEFTTGNHISVVEFTQSIDASSIGQGQLIGFTIEMNGGVITELQEVLRDAASAEQVALLYYRFIIPPYTEVTTKAYTDDSSQNPFFHTITGRIYR